MHTRKHVCTHMHTHIHTQRGRDMSSWIEGISHDDVGEFLDSLLCMFLLHMFKMKRLHWIISKIPFQHQVLCVFDQRYAIVKTKLLRMKEHIAI